MGRHADECYLTAGFDAAVDAQREALVCFRRLGDRRAEGDALRSLSRLLFFANRTEEAEPLVAAAVELLERCRRDDRVGCARAALAERLDDTEARVYALTNVGAAQLQRDDPDGLPTLERALAHARQVLRKLDVASRGEAAAKALRLGLTT